MKIGILGGSFNPPHNMHKDIALSLILKGILDKVIFIPTGNRYGKKELEEASHRFNMLKIVCKKYENIEVSDYEIKQQLVYTYQTLDYFKSLSNNSEFYFIVGADNLAELKDWKNYNYLISNYRFIVINREGESLEELLKEHNYHPNIVVTDVAMNNISSTKIRKMIKENDKLVKNYIDKDVLEYIKQNKLYIS